MANNKNSYIKYSGIAFQLAGLILMAYFIGNALDKKFQNTVPYFTLALIVFVFTGYIYKLYRELFPNERR